LVRIPNDYEIEFENIIDFWIEAFMGLSIVRGDVVVGACAALADNHKNTLRTGSN
jgi:hypothetical protein